MRPSLRSASLLTALVLALSACGGGQDSGTAPAKQQGPRLFAATVQSAAPEVFNSPLASYSIGKTADGYLVTDSSGREAPRTVAATARLRFSDTSLSFDADGIPGQIYRLYRAAFARTPDAAGLGYWLGLLDQGAVMGVVSQGFVDSAEFKNLYAGATTNSAVVNQFYLNVLNRQGDDGGIAYWNNVLDSKADTVAGVLASFSASPENISGTAAAVQNGIAYLEAGVAYAPAFPLRAAYHQRTFAGGTDYLTVTGSCNGYAAFSNAVPASSTFEGGSALAAQTTISLGLTTCTPRDLGWSLTDYFDSSDALLGHAEPGAEYDVAYGAQRSLPAAAKIGDSGTYAVQSRYADSSKQGTPGQRVLSYVLEADGSSATTAILKLTAQHISAASQTTLTRSTSYRISASGTLEQLSVDEAYSSGIHLLYTQTPASAQPASLIVTDTVAGSGTGAQSGQTLTVNYTGWLYNPAAGDFKGQQFDTSISAGRTPFEFPLGMSRVIKGWDQGMVGMKVGGKRTLLIPSSLGYGTSGSAPSIPGNAALVFEVELLSIK
ncbi:FKBP-type peptidyl-prolyl cis-trans isomerase [Pseudoduganella sp. LjRoot289]|uniref:FKBP-type peptidyl-prolyl cis-trans isomerase n=1 Tax=Pseudoduganella sp. LjRoot289 TaxID=3342314 RepID=UPI003ECEF215